MDFFCLTFDVADQYRGADPALFWPDSYPPFENWIQHNYSIVRRS